MSMGTSCKMEMGTRCSRSTWLVTQRLCNHSAFNGYHYTPSAYSTVRCFSCGKHWRTKADYVFELRNAPDDWAGRSDADVLKSMKGAT